MQQETNRSKVTFSVKEGGKLAAPVLDFQQSGTEAQRNYDQRMISHRKEKQSQLNLSRISSIYFGQSRSSGHHCNNNSCSSYRRKGRVRGSCSSMSSCRDYGDVNAMIRNTEGIVGSAQLWMKESERLLSEVIKTTTGEEGSRSVEYQEGQDWIGVQGSSGKTTKLKEQKEHACNHSLKVSSKDRRPRVPCIVVDDTDTDIIWSNLVGTMDDYGGSGESLKQYSEDEWENTLARRILRVYANKVTDEHIQANNCSDSNCFTENTDCRPNFCRKGERILPKLHSVSDSNTVAIAKCQSRETAMRPKDSSHSLASTYLNKSSGGNKAKSKAVETPIVPKMIWFWGGKCTSSFRSSSYGAMPEDIKSMLLNENYGQFLATTESMLVRSSEIKSAMKRENCTFFCLAFAEKAIEAKRFPVAMDLLHRASSIASDDDRGPLEVRTELLALVNGVYAYYYTRRNKYSASLRYLNLSIKLQKKKPEWNHMALYYLHASFALGKLKRHTESLRRLNDVISLFQKGLLTVEFHRQNLLLLAITYHNIAVQQIAVEKIRHACISSQNARRLAKVCSSYSNAYVRQFEATHRVCLDRLLKIVARTPQNHNQKADELQLMFKGIIRELFD